MSKWSINRDFELVMRVLKTWTLLLCLPLMASAQYANDWVQPGRPYLRISIASDAIYKLTYSDLVDAGLPVGVIDPRLIQVFHRGKEQAILFHHSQLPANDQFEPTEYLEFYGRRNDGILDAGLYLDAGTQPHSYYNLYSDSAAYFLTWNPAAVQGKRMEQFDQVNSTGIPAETSLVAGELKLFTSEYCEGPGSTTIVPQSYFDQGEGWTGQIICTGPGCSAEFRDFTFENITQAVAGHAPHVSVLVTGRDQTPHRVELFAGPNTGALRHITTRTFSNFETPLISEDIALSDVGPDGKITFRVRAIGVGGAPDRLSVSYIDFSFPRALDMQGAQVKTFSLHPNVNGKSYIEVINAPADARIFDITDPAEVVQIGTHSSGSALTAVIPNTSVSRRILLTSTVQTVSPTQLEEISFRDLNRRADFVIISHRSLRKAGGGYPDPVSAYAAYRASEEGGGYDTLTVMIEELYDQFNFGEKSPLAVREFLRRLTALGKPNYVFIIGKGRSLTAQYHRRAPLPDELPDLVPVGGSPASDYVFTMGLEGGKFVQAIPIGRIPATTPAEVAAYLNKVKEHELPTAVSDWQKRVLHLSGGIQPAELSTFRQFMKGFEAIAESKYLGAEVLTLGKHSVSPVEFINISKEVNEGVNLVTFFGHSSSYVTDIDIGAVTDPLLGFSNKGKYPMFLVNGCNAGDFFTNGANFGENWVLAANRGARNFIANSSFGYPTILRLYTDTFYETALGDSVNINMGIGDALAELSMRLVAHDVDPNIITAQVQQMILLGDPAMRVLNSTRPDFETSDAFLQVSATDNKPVHALSDSLKVSIIVKNRGKASDTPLMVRLLHTRDTETIQRDSAFQSVLNLDTLTWVLARGNGNFFGQNRLEVQLDPENETEELLENNNVASWSALITFNGTMNLQPPQFAVVNSQNVELVFQDTDLMAPQRTYLLEVDTAANFSSPYKQSYTVSSQVLARKQIVTLNQDSLVYYWRSKRADDSDALWETTSFAHIADGGTGFAQLNFDQLLSNSTQGLISSSALEEFEFESTSSSFSVRTFGGMHASAPANGSFQVNDAEYYHSPQGFACRNNTMNLVAFDRASSVPYLAVPFVFQNSFGRSCGREPMIINSFTATEVETGLDDDLFRYVDEVEEGDSVVLFTMGDAGISLWSTAVRNKLGELGISSADLAALTPGEPVIILARKGAAPGSASVLRAVGASPETQELQRDGTVTGRIPVGTMRSVVIGPSVKWRDIAHKTTDMQSSDEVSVDLYGVKKDGTPAMIEASISTPFDLGSVDAQHYPYLRLVFNVKDEQHLTPAQLSYWIVRYDPAPDGLLVLRNPRRPVTVQEGQSQTLDLSFVNISPVSFQDSLSVSVRLFNRTKSEIDASLMRLKGPAQSDSSHFSIPFSTRGKVGSNDITLSVNTGLITEQYLQNNTLELPGHLLVSKDQTHPLLDIAVDGRYLVNGDLVSSNPSIDIRLRDENVLMGKLDTTSLSVFLTYPCPGNCTPTRISFSSDEVIWSSDPARPDLQVEFKPTSLPNGTYELRVQGFDASGNASGPEPYEIQFEVNSDPVVRYSQPYPNPSSSGFLFEFQSAGAADPEGMALQIFSSAGRLVASFDETSAPPLHVGWNSLKWTGLDDFGGVLSPGLYFYSMSVIVGGNAYTTSGKLLIQY